MRKRLISDSSKAVAKKSGKGPSFTIACGCLHYSFYYPVAKNLAEKSGLNLF